MNEMLSHWLFYLDIPILNRDLSSIFSYTNNIQIICVCINKH